MRHFGVKLDTEERLRVVCNGSEWCSACLSNDMKVRWNLVYLVTVRHPDLVTSVRERTVMENGCALGRSYRIPRTADPRARGLLQV
jgi:hypothetical protein